MIAANPSPAHPERHGAAMPSALPEYRPPGAQRAGLAAGVAPLLVLLSFTLTVIQLIEVDTAFAIFAACTVWVVHEMNCYQKTIDGYNAEYVSRHLAWRSSSHLQEVAADHRVSEPTRAFVGSFLQAQRVLLRDGQCP